MKKNVLIALALTLALAGCSPAAPAEDHSGELESLKAQIEELQKENKELKAQLETSELKEQFETTVPETTVKETQAAEQGISIAVGETITTDTLEITINKVELTNDVLPDDTSGIYHHYEADAGNVYLHLDTDIKNLDKQRLICDEIMKATADYNGGYTYTGQAIPEDGSSNFTFANITAIPPLATLGVHFLFKCPQEVKESENPLFMTIEPSGSKDSYILTVR